VAALVGSPLSHGNAYDVLTNGNEIFPAMLGAINAAATRISFETYIYESGAIAEQFTSALADTARRGVSTNVIVDFFGSSAMPREHVKRLKDAGAHVAEFNSPKWYQIQDLNYRTHRKILVVDGVVGFVGGVGVADHWTGNAEDEHHWRDTQIRIEGPLARLLEGAFYENFIEAGGLVQPVLPDAVPPRAADGTAVLVKSAASTGGNDLKRLYLLSIAMARHTIDITSPYFVTDESTMWSIEDALDRGVRIRILMESDMTDARPVKYASRRQYARRLERGVQLFEYKKTMMHAKSMVVDGVWSTVGSANFDNRSLELNDELNVAIAGREFATRLRDGFEQDLQVSRRIQLDAWRRRPLLEKTRERFWGYFGEVF
jgi:cardiolipin synthase